MIIGVIVCAIVGALCIIWGIQCFRGNISSLHEYHKTRVKKEDVLPFSRTIGAGLITVGGSVIAFGVALILNEAVGGASLAVGLSVLGAGTVAGIAILIYATKKYNGGIF